MKMIYRMLTIVLKKKFANSSQVVADTKQNDFDVWKRKKRKTSMLSAIEVRSKLIWLKKDLRLKHTNLDWKI